MEILYFWYMHSNLIQWAGETQLSIQSIITLDEIALGEFFIPKRRSRHHFSVEIEDEILNLIATTF